MQENKSNISADIRAFSRALSKHWKWWIGSTLAAAVIGLFLEVGGVISKIALIVWSIVLGIPVAAFLAWREQYHAAAQLMRRLEPKLSFVWDEDSLDCVAEQLTQSNQPSKWMRLKVIASGGEVIKDCKANLVSIKKKNKTLWSGEKQGLPFSHGDVFIKTIDAGTHETVDVVMAVKDTKFWAIGSLNLGWRHSKHLDQIFKETGDYILEIEVSSSSLPDCERVLAGFHFDVAFNEWPFITDFTQLSQSTQLMATSPHSLTL